MSENINDSFDLLLDEKNFVEEVVISFCATEENEITFTTEDDLLPFCTDSLEELFIPYEFKPLRHKGLLGEAENYIVRRKKIITSTIISNCINDENHTELFDKVVNTLRYVGELSMEAFKIENELRDKYTLAFIHDSALGDIVFFKHYNTIHRPYNLLKNRCYKLLDTLDAAYEAKFNKQPPNIKSKKSIFY